MYRKVIGILFVIAALEDSGVISDPPIGQLVLHWTFYPSGQSYWDPFLHTRPPMSFPHDIPRETTARPTSGPVVPVVTRPTEGPVSWSTGEPIPGPPTSGPIPGSTGGPVSASTGKPATLTPERPVSWPTGKPATLTPERPVSRPTGKPATLTPERPVSWPTGKPATLPTEKPAQLTTGKPAPLATVTPSTVPAVVTEIHVSPEEALNTMVVDPDESPEVVQNTYSLITGALAKVGVLKDTLFNVLNSLKKSNACKGTPKTFNINCCSESIQGHKFCFSSHREIVGISTSITYNDMPLFHRVSQGDMPFACVQFLPSISLLSFCVKMYDVERTDKRFHACYYFTIRVLKKDIVSLDFECIEINAEGTIKFMPSKKKKDVGYWNYISSKLNPLGDGPIDVVEQAQNVANFGKKVFNFLG